MPPKEIFPNSVYNINLIKKEENHNTNIIIKTHLGWCSKIIKVKIKKCTNNIEKYGLKYKK